MRRFGGVAAVRTERRHSSETAGTTAFSGRNAFPDHAAGELATAHLLFLKSLASAAVISFCFWCRSQTAIVRW